MRFHSSEAVSSSTLSSPLLSSPLVAANGSSNGLEWNGTERMGCSSQARALVKQLFSWNWIIKTICIFLGALEYRLILAR